MYCGQSGYFLNKPRTLAFALQQMKNHGENSEYPKVTS